MQRRAVDLDAGDLTLAAELFDEGDGPWVVLLHGGGFTLRCWDRVIESLRPGVRICAVDLPGHGRSDDLVDATFEALGRQVAAALHAAQVIDPVIVGWSLGWPIALSCAAARSDVRGLVSVDGSVAPYAEEIAPFYASIGAYLADVRARDRDRTANDDDDLQRQIAQDPLSPGWDAELTRRWRQRPDGSYLCRPSASASIELAVSNIDFDVARCWAEARAPIRYLLATHQPDAVVALHRAAAVQRSVSHDATRTTEVAASHALPIDAPEAVADAINELIDDTATGARGSGPRQ